MADLAQFRDILTSLLYDRYMTKLCAVSATTIVVYDYFVTFTREVEYMWRSRWSFGKVLFFGIRYYSVAMIIFNTAVITSDNLSQEVAQSSSTDVCAFSECLVSYTYTSPGSAWVNWHWVSTIVSTIMSETVLMLRIYVMFMKSKKIFALLATAYVVTFAVTSTIAIKIMIVEKVTINPFPGLTTTLCAATEIPKWFYAYWIPFLVFETLLFALAIVKGYSSFRGHVAKGPVGGRILIECLVHDSVLYFFVIFVIYLVTVLVWVIGGIGFIEIPIGFSLALASVLSQRMFLNMRAVGEKAQSTHRMPSSSRDGVASATHQRSILHTYGYDASRQYIASQDLERDRKRMSVPLKTFSVG